MKRLIFSALVATCSLPAVTFAQNTEDSGKETTDVSKNPLTGSTTVTKKSERRVKHADGSDAKRKVTKKTKYKKDGSVEHSVDGSASEAPATTPGNP